MQQEHLAEIVERIERTIVRIEKNQKVQNDTLQSIQGQLDSIKSDTTLILEEVNPESAVGIQVTFGEPIPQ